MTEHTKYEAAKEEARKHREEKQKQKPSIYFDTPLRTEFLMIIAMTAHEGEKGWEYFSEEILPRLLNEAKECSRTPKLDKAFIEGAASALNAQRALNNVRRSL